MDFSLTAHDVSADGASHRVVEVAGEVDIYVAATFGSYLLGQITEHQAPAGAGDGQEERPRRGAVVLDLTGMTFIDSSGLGVLVGAYKKARAGGSPLRLVSSSSQVRQLLQLTGLTRVLVTFSTVGEACAA